MADLVECSICCLSGATRPIATTEVKSIGVLISIVAGVRDTRDARKGRAYILATRRKRMGKGKTRAQQGALKSSDDATCKRASHHLHNVHHSKGIWRLLTFYT